MSQQCMGQKDQDMAAIDTYYLHQAGSRINKSYNPAAHPSTNAGKLFKMPQVKNETNQYRHEDYRASLTDLEQEDQQKLFMYQNPSYVRNPMQEIPISLLKDQQNRVQFDANSHISDPRNGQKRGASNPRIHSGTRVGLNGSQKLHQKSLMLNPLNNDCLLSSEQLSHLDAEGQMKVPIKKQQTVQYYP